MDFRLDDGQLALQDTIGRYCASRFGFDSIADREDTAIDRLTDGRGAQRLHQLGTLLSAAMLVGVSDAALDLARDHALNREQFGVAIGSFQALKHMMADMFVRTGLARGAAYAAAAVLDDPSLSDPERALHGAKLLSGEAAIDNARAAVQVLGGMGFTWDMPPNFLLKRAWVLDTQFGSVDHHAGMELTVAASQPGRVVFTVDQDMTMLARWAELRRAVVTWTAVGDRTRVSWRLEYERLLYPTAYFAPLQRFGMDQAAGYLLHSVVTEQLR